MPAAPGPDAENTIPPETAVADSPPDRATEDPLPDPPESSSRSARMCERYTNLVSRPLQATSLLLDDESPIKTRVEECANFTPLVVGGQNASENEFPHMAAIGFRSGGELGWLCGGSLISEQFVLTAAHCTHTAWGPPVVVRLGTRNIGADAWPPPLDAAVRDVVVHPLYAPPARYHDIALVRLARPVAVSRRIRPACLPTQDPGVEAVAVATGWGRLSYAGDTTDVLQKVSLRVWDGPACSRLYPPDAELGRGRLREGLGPGMLCAGDAFSTKDTCQGDSGGPLQVSVGCSFQVVGITSFGKECGLGLPAVYTRVSQYVSWIEDVVWPQ